MTTLRNRVQLVGNLGIDPEIVKFESGKKLAKFTLATNETYTDAKGNKTTDTQWHNIVAWGKQADLVEQHLKKGNNATIEGKLTYRQYEDKNKQKHYITEILLSSFILSKIERESA
ncbi:MAG: single-stranded DNA-binding protein [Prolixibacteraceae bacterium]|nr:single-stranded DNA-binding protein [Prolixibacteraceae bacterium]MBN2650160.1 single-stranded DNA-binding protein [Prolixibacteraceae bacterium]